MPYGDWEQHYQEYKAMLALEEKKHAPDKGEAGESWIQTFTGIKFDPLQPDPSAVDIRDIAHALSLQTRFGGHTKDFYSIAQHSVLVSLECDPADALWGLLHDASEAYIADVCRPVKRQRVMDGYRKIEGWIMAAVCDRFDLPHEQPASVKRADELLLVTEARDLLGPLVPGWKHRPEHGYAAMPTRIEPVLPRVAEDMFLWRFELLANAYELPIKTLWGPV